MNPTRHTPDAAAAWAFPAMVWPQIIETAYRQEQLIMDATRHRRAMHRTGTGVSTRAAAWLRHRLARPRPAGPATRPLHAGS